MKYFVNLLFKTTHTLFVLSILFPSIVYAINNDPLYNLLVETPSIEVTIDKAIVGEVSRVTVKADNLQPWTIVSIEGFNYCYFAGFRKEGERDYLCTPVEIGQKKLTVLNYDLPIYSKTIHVTQRNQFCADEFESNNTHTEATNITGNNLQLHSICPNNDQDWFKIYLPYPMGVKAFTFGESGSDTTIDLYNSDLQLIESNDDIDNSNRNSSINIGCYTPLDAGIYYFKVKSYSNGLVDPSTISAYLMQFRISGCLDTDNDHIPDSIDKFPNDPTEWSDNDDDGIGDNTDLDDDNDKMSDLWEQQNGLDPFNSADALFDNDNDGIKNIDEYLALTNPNIPNAPRINNSAIIVIINELLLND